MKVVISTCDSYAWLAPIFLHFYRKNWPDNPYETVYLTETREIDGVSTFCAGKIEWSDRTAKYLEASGDESFLLFFDDYIIEKLVNTGIVERAEKLCVDDIGCLRLQRHDHESRHLAKSAVTGYKEYPHDKPYSVSLQIAVWQREFFFEFLRKGETVWDTEIKGSKRILGSSKRVLWTDTPAFIYNSHGYMQKGVIDASVERWAKENW